MIFDLLIANGSRFVEAIRNTIDKFKRIGGGRCDGGPVDPFLE